MRQDKVQKATARPTSLFTFAARHAEHNRDRHIHLATTIHCCRAYISAFLFLYWISIEQSLLFVIAINYCGTHFNALCLNIIDGGARTLVITVFFQIFPEIMNQYFRHRRQSLIMFVSAVSHIIVLSRLQVASHAILCSSQSYSFWRLTPATSKKKVPNQTY